MNIKQTTETVLNTPMRLVVMEGDTERDYHFHDLFDFMHCMMGEGKGIPSLESPIVAIYVNGTLPFSGLAMKRVSTVKKLLAYARGMWYALDTLD